MIDYEIAVLFLSGSEKIGKILLNYDELYISVFDYSFLLAGAESSKNVSHNLYLIKEFINENVEIIDFTKKEANAFARIKTKYELDNMVLLNASLALSRKLKILTADESYTKIKELKSEIIKA
ncbi:PIN domain-containing protein [Caminibacter pacificus]